MSSQWLSAVQKRLVVEIAEYMTADGGTVNKREIGRATGIADASVVRILDGSTVEHRGQRPLIHQLQQRVDD